MNTQPLPRRNFPVRQKEQAAGPALKNLSVYPFLLQRAPHQTVMRVMQLFTACPRVQLSGTAPFGVLPFLPCSPVPEHIR